MEALYPIVSMLSVLSLILAPYANLGGDLVGVFMLLVAPWLITTGWICSFGLPANVAKNLAFCEILMGAALVAGGYADLYAAGQTEPYAMSWIIWMVFSGAILAGVNRAVNGYTAQQRTFLDVGLREFRGASRWERFLAEVYRIGHDVRAIRDAMRLNGYDAKKARVARQGGHDQARWRQVAFATNAALLLVIAIWSHMPYMGTVAWVLFGLHIAALGLWWHAYKVCHHGFAFYGPAGRVLWKDTLPQPRQH